MIDLINFIVGCACAFILGLVSHSILMHEKRRQGWKFPWDHNEGEEDNEEA